jgi:hypothetical protein
MELGRSAWRKYGKGRHAAPLNHGDCFAYALAEALGEPLLFVGEDFRRMEITPALADEFRDVDDVRYLLPSLEPPTGYASIDGTCSTHSRLALPQLTLATALPGRRVRG